MKRSVSVTIAGQKFALRTDGDEASVKALAGFVDEKFRQVQKQSRAPDTQTLALLTALRIAEELFELRAVRGEESRQEKQLRKLIREKGRALLEFLEREGGV